MASQYQRTVFRPKTAYNRHNTHSFKYLWRIFPLSPDFDDVLRL